MLFGKINADTKHEIRTLLFAALALFLSIAFTVTIAFLFFFRSMALPEEQVRAAAPMTFVVVLVITIIFVLFYEVIRYITVIKPLKMINKGLERIAAGDFSERLSLDESYGKFYPIAQNVNRMTEELASSTLMKTDFISNVSHELKTPLAVIGNYGRLLEEEGLSEEKRREYAAAIASAAGRMSDLITNILRMNRLENQRLTAKRESFDLSTQLTEFVLQYESVWEEKGIELAVDIEDGVEIVSDEELLGFVWSNLLSNAFKFTENGGTVHIGLKAMDGHAVVEVSDTGCGMDEETGRHIFDKFYQGDTSHATQGNGLGLALVKRVIDLVGGEISVSSTLGEGSTFRVSLKMK